ncbi:MAG: hypothetical protein ACPG05_01125 [Bdellovibrionales bacterium]
MANTWLKVWATGDADDFLNNPIIEGLSTDTRAQASMQNILGAAAEQQAWAIGDVFINGPDNPEYKGKDADYVFEQEFKTNEGFRNAVIEAAIDNPEARGDLLNTLKGMEQDELNEYNETIASAEAGSAEHTTAMEGATATQANINALDQVSAILQNEAAVALMATPEGRAQVSSFLKDFANKAVDGDVTPQEQQELQQAHQGLIDAGVQLAINDPESLGTLAQNIKGLATGINADVATAANDASVMLETTSQVLQNPVLQAVQAAQPAAFTGLATDLTNKEISGDVTPQDVLSGINANPALSASLVNAAVANPSAFKELLDRGPAGAQTAQLDVAGYANIRNAAVDAAMANPAAVGTLVETLGIENAELESALPVLENEFVQDILAADPSLAYKMADPANGGDYQAIIEGHIKANPELLSVAHQSLQDHRADAEALTPLMGDATAQQNYTQMLEQFSQFNASQVQTLASNVSSGQTIQMAAAGVVVDPIITLAQNQSNPDAHLQAGEQFIDVVADKLGGGAAVMASVQALKSDPDLMRDIGADFAEKGAEIKAALPNLLAGNMTGANNFLKAHPEIAQAGVVLQASADPQQAGQMALDSIETTLNESVLRLPAAERAEAQEYVNSFVSEMGSNQAFLNAVGERLADPDKVGNLLSGQSAGFNQMKLVTDDLRDPSQMENTLDMLSSDRAMAYMAQRYSGDLTEHAKIGGLDKMQQALADVGSSEGAQKIKEFTGIDIGGILAGFGDKLPGFANDFQERMQFLGGYAGNNMLNFSVTNGWMEGFSAGGNMTTGNDNMFGPLMNRFAKFGSGMYVTNHAQVTYATDGQGNVSVSRMEGWADNQHRAASANLQVDPATGRQMLHWTNPDGTTGKVDPKDPQAREKMEAQGWGSGSGSSTPTQVVQNNQSNEMDRDSLSPDPTGLV